VPSTVATNALGTGAEHLARLGAGARATGSAAASEARRYCADVLQRRGFQVREQEFEYSQFPGRWATPTAGFLIPVIATAIVALRSTVHWWLPVAVTAVLAIGAAVAAVQRGGVLGFPLARARGMNLEATRGGDEPSVWLVAHIDSKWQPVSMLVRVAGVVLVGIGVIGLAVALTAWSRTIADFLALLWVGGIPLMLSVVGDRNHGTLDNASGVAAVLEAVELLPETTSVGVLISDAEELALAGATAWARGRRAGGALNCDSVDDDGELVVMYTGSIPRQLVSSFARAASDAGERLRTLRLLPGILTDSVALTQAGWNTVTLSRGTIRTLGRIHTSRDSLATMDGRGIAGAARVLARVVMEMS
jgi:hypothetical protein